MIRCITDYIYLSPNERPSPRSTLLVGILEGEGVGPEVMRSTLQVLSALESTGTNKFEVRFGGPIGNEAKLQYGKELCDDVVMFCEDIFSQGGAILAGPGGGRFVYDLRRQFDLFCKISPLKTNDELSNIHMMKSPYVRNVDMIIVRENVSGVYQGEWGVTSSGNGGRKATHSFSYSEKEVYRILKVAAEIASHRSGKISVIYKDAGIPSISKLWSDCTAGVASETGIEYSLFDVDFAAYCLIQQARELDVVVAPNLFGDILSDLGGILVGSRALTYSGNFSSDRKAVYQTNHGAAYDLAGTDRANPVGQIYSLVMLLRESFGLIQEAQLIEEAIADVWRQGWRTSDLAEPGCRIAKTSETGEIIAMSLIKLSRSVDFK